MPRRASFHNHHSNLNSMSGINGGSPRTTVASISVTASPKTTYERRRRSYSLELKNWQGQTLHQYNYSLGLQSSDIAILLREVIPKYSKDKELVCLARQHHQQIADAALASSLDTNSINLSETSRGLHSHYYSTTGSSNRSISENSSSSTLYPSSDDHLEDVVAVLEVFLNSAAVLPPCVVGAVHSTIGLIRQRQRFYDCAVQSLQRALWVKNSARETPEEIGMALHRLAIAYGRMGDQYQACCLLEKALVKYDEANWSKHHPFVNSAKEKLERCKCAVSHYAACASPPGVLRRASSTQESLSPSSAAQIAAPSSAPSYNNTRSGLASTRADWRSLPAMPNLR